MKKFKNIFILSVVALLGLQLAACSDDDYDTNPYAKSGVNLLAFGPSPNTRSGELRITGTNLNQVDKVVFPAGNVERAGRNVAYTGAVIERSNFLSADNENILVTIPETAVPGTIRLVTGNDTIVSKGLITFEEPIKVTSVTPMDNLNAGDEITIKGEYVYNIATVTFSSGVSGAPVAAEQFTYVSRNELRLQVPLSAESGVITFSDGADWEESFKDAITINTATISGITPYADFGQQIQITGSNLHIVESLMFAGGVSADFTISDDHNTITTTVPAIAKSGPLSLVLYSGEVIATPELTLPMAAFESVNPNKDVKAGMTLTITGQHLDRIVEMTVPGLENPMKKGEFNQSETEISFVVPEEMTDGKIKMKQHDNHIIETSAIMMYSESPEQAIWAGEFVCSSWAGNQDLAWGGFDWTTIAANTVVKFYYKKNNPGQWGCISLRHGDNWGNLPAPIPGQYDLDEDEGILSVTFPQNVLDDLIANNGLVITGDNYTLTKVTIPAPVTETVIWKGDGSAAVSWNGIYRFGLEGHDGNNECIATFPADVWNKIKTGPFYMQYKAADPYSYQIRITTGWWSIQWLGQDNDIAPWNMSERIKDNGDGTFYIEVNFGNDPIVGSLDVEHLLLTGNGYTPLKLYFKN